MIFARGRNKVLGLILAGCIAFSGCAQKGEGKAPSPTRAIKTLQFEVNTNLEKEFLEQAELFAAYVDRISRGRLAISVVKKQSEELPEAEYDFAYLRNRQAAQIDPTLSTLSLPFLYSDSAHLSLSLNSFDMMKLLRERLKGRIYPLAALSSGNALLISTKPASKKDMGMPIYFQDLVIGLHEGFPETLMAFQSLGACISLYPPDTLLTVHLGREAVSLQPESPIPGQTTIQGIEANRDDVLEMPDITSVLYALETEHDLSPVWLTAKDDTWQNLSEWEQAVIQEAVASLLAGFEENRSRYHAAWEKEAGKRGIVLVKPEQQALNGTIYDDGRGSAYFLIPPYFDSKLFELVQNYR